MRPGKGWRKRAEVTRAEMLDLASRARYKIADMCRIGAMSRMFLYLQLQRMPDVHATIRQNRGPRRGRVLS